MELSKIPNIVVLLALLVLVLKILVSNTFSVGAYAIFVH